MLLPSFTMGFDASNEHTYACMLHVITKPMGDSAIVTWTLASSLDARNEGHVGFIAISSTLEDEGAQTTNDLQEVSVPDSDEESDEGVQSVAPKKKQRKNYNLNQKI